MKRSFLGLTVVLAAALAAACTTGDQNSTSNSGGGGAGGSGASSAGGGGTGGGDTGGKGTGGKGTGGDGTGGSSTGGGNTGGSTGGTGGSMMGGPCGGIVGDTCDPSQYCDYDDDMCGTNDGGGTCADKPDGCPDVYDPVCACDGKVYGNACEAAAAGLDVTSITNCPTPDGLLPCGRDYCDIDTQYCEVVVSDIPGVPDTTTCKDLPANCAMDGTASCGCLADLPCANLCQQADGGGLTLTCPGG